MKNKHVVVRNTIVSWTSSAASCQRTKYLIKMTIDKTAIACYVNSVWLMSVYDMIMIWKWNIYILHDTLYTVASASSFSGLISKPGYIQTTDHNPLELRNIHFALWLLCLFMVDLYIIVPAQGYIHYHQHLHYRHHNPQAQCYFDASLIFSDSIWFYLAQSSSALVGQLCTNRQYRQLWAAVLYLLISVHNNTTQPSQ